MSSQVLPLATVVALALTAILQHSSVVDAACSAASSGSSYTGTSGTIMSDVDGSGTTNYANNEDCVWYVSCTSGTFSMTTNIDTESVFDVVSIRAGRSTTGSLLASRSGSSTAWTYSTVTYGTVTITFTTDSSVNRDGFTMSWSCTGGTSGGTPIPPTAGTPTPGTGTCSALTANTVYSSTSGQIMSDSDGAGTGTRYSNSENCYWYVSCPVGTRFSMSMNIDTESCCDRVYIYSGSTASTSTVNYLFRASGSSPQTFTATERQVTIRFSTDGSVTDNGFTMDYSCITAAGNPATSSPSGSAVTPTPFGPITPIPIGSPTSSCLYNAGIRTSWPGIVQSDTDGDGPSTYHANQDCEWILTCPTNRYVAFSTLRIDVENCCDTIRVYTASGATEITRFVSDGTYSNRAFDYSSVAFRFATDSSVQMSGFYLSWTCVDASTRDTYQANYNGGYYNYGTASTTLAIWLIIVFIVLPIVIIVGIIICIVCCCCKSNPPPQTVIVQQQPQQGYAQAQPVEAYPPTASGAYPPQPGYDQQQQGYPPQQGGYPPQQGYTQGGPDYQPQQQQSYSGPNDVPPPPQKQV